MFFFQIYIIKQITVTKQLANVAKKKQEQDFPLSSLNLVFYYNETRKFYVTDILENTNLIIYKRNYVTCGSFRVLFLINQN